MFLIAKKKIFLYLEGGKKKRKHHAVNRIVLTELKIQREADVCIFTKMLRGLKHFSVEESLRDSTGKG